MGFVFGLQGITNFNFPKFIFLIKSSPVGYPSSAVGFSTTPLGPGWISFQSCDSLTIWRNKLAKPKPQDWDVQPLYFFFWAKISTSCLTGKKNVETALQWICKRHPQNGWQGNKLGWAGFKDNTEFLAQAPTPWTEVGTRQQATASSSRQETRKRLLMKLFLSLLIKAVFWICEVYKFPSPNSTFLQVRVPVPGREERIQIMQNLIEKIHCWTS